MTSPEAKEAFESILADLTAHQMNGLADLEDAVSRCVERAQGVLRDWVPTAAPGLPEDAESRAMMRGFLASLAMAGMLARPAVYREGSPDPVDGFAFWPAKDVAGQAVEFADALMEELNKEVNHASGSL